MNLMLAYKALAAVLAVVVAITGMGGGVVLAAETLPGDFLYPVKLFSEDVRLALTPDPAGRAELEMAFVALRVQEMARLAQQGQEVPQAVVGRMTRQMEQAMVEIAQARPEEVPALLERVMERTRLHQQVLEGVATGSSAATRTRLREASQLMERTRLSAENDPKYLEYLHQYQYEGAPGPHGEISPPPQGAGQQTQEQNQERTQEQNQEQTQEQTQEQAQEQNQEQTQEQNQEQTQEETQEQYQYGQDDTTGPRGGH